MLAIYMYTRDWGGVNVLIERFAHYLHSKEIKFCIIESSGTRLRDALPEAYFLTAEQVHEVAMQVTHVFVPSLPKLRDPPFPWAAFANAKVLVWIVHPNDAFRAFFPYSSATIEFFGYRIVKPLREIFSLHALIFDKLFFRLTSNKALIVMDAATCRALKFFSPAICLEPEMTPIPSPVYEQAVGRPRQINDVLSIGYLGRMDVMKWSAIRPFIAYSLAPLARKRKVALHLISEGSHLSNVKRLCLKYGIEFHDYGYLPNLEARELIIKNTHLAVAMGTSALDIAGSGHPCVIINPGIGLFPGKQVKFRFVHEIEGCTLGEFRGFPGYVDGIRKFEDMVNFDKLKDAAEKGRLYVSSYHDPQLCFDRLISQIYSSNLNLSDLYIVVRELDLSFREITRRPLHGILARIKS